MACWETPHLNENLPPQNHPIISHEDPRYNIPKSSQNHPMTLSHHKLPRRNHGFAWRFSPDLVMRGDLRGGRIACGVNGILGADECHHLWRDGMGWASPIFTLNASKRTRISLEPKFFISEFWGFDFRDMLRPKKVDGSEMVMVPKHQVFLKQGVLPLLPTSASDPNCRGNVGCLWQMWRPAQAFQTSGEPLTFCWRRGSHCDFTSQRGIFHDFSPMKNGDSSDLSWFIHQE